MRGGTHARAAGDGGARRRAVFAQALALDPGGTGLAMTPGGAAVVGGR